jgi:hypothetical protein
MGELTTEARIPLTARQADWLADLAASGSETYTAAIEAGARIEAAPGGAEVLVVPPAAAEQLGLAVGIRADIASEGEYDIGLRSSVLGLSRKLAAHGISNAAPLTVADVYGQNQET